MTASLELREYESWVGAMEPSARDELMTLADDRLDVRVVAGGEVEIKATSHVGVLVTSTLIVRVRPKVDLDNLFFMLGVGGTSWQVGRTPGPYGVEEDDLLTAVVRLFALEVDRLSSRGLRHGYVSYDERLLSLRGRVDLGSQMRRPWERSPVPCRFDEFVPDIWLNQVLFAALNAVRGVPGLPGPVRGEVHLLSQRFEGVSHRTIDVNKVERWKPSRNDRHYEIAIRLAAIILRRLSLTDRTGRARAASFTIDMNKLYEEFLGREIASRLPRGLALTEQYSTSLDRRGRFSIVPDFVLHPHDEPRRPVYVADAKYKLTESLGVISDHYQLLAYATVFGLREGTLIYCQRPDNEEVRGDVAPVHSVVVRGADIENFVYRLDVTGSRSAIGSRLDDLVDWLLDRSALERDGHERRLQTSEAG